ncbi:unnamed protein product [Rotaria sp. Silwood2]|nr:unnamed protein product [Rotaria sp. Silwood2]CAF2522964.1 unnamed protein product [Rotaria sp. Silwood2]CAF2943862.1 unnamed protein product [Rotaria sp. Silwood2]CAF3901769.1 unnamed protein product [Rotaria sp. Silwood2]CAF3907221.1 unnamed protein product [Rotaria sp. Silwood2]
MKRSFKCYIGARVVLADYNIEKGNQVVKQLKVKTGYDVDVFAVNPSWVWTSIQASMPEVIGHILFIIFYPILYILEFILAKTPKTGARTSVFCTVEPTLQHRHDFYFEDCAVETVSSLCTNYELANQLWKLSYEAVGM